MEMFKLVKNGFNKDNIISFGNMFLIGNGHLGYRGTLEEYSKSEMIGLNVLGFYDRYKKLWRESINMPNPFKVVIDGYSVLENEPINHNQSLDIKHAIFNRHTEYNDVQIDSERFVSSTVDNLLAFKYTIKALKDVELKVSLGMDTDIYESNGPHFKNKKVTKKNKTLVFKGKTNENKIVIETASYIFKSNDYTYDNGTYFINLNLKNGEEYVIYCISRIFEDGILQKERYTIKKYKELKKDQIKNFEKKWKNSYVNIVGDDRSQFAINYSIYHLLILGSETHETSIPARGVSGSVYKGAIFWDTEIFMVPFFTTTNVEIARKLLKYRINTLNGALNKAKEYGYDGAFFAWESQEFGQDGCSKYNITDAETGKPVRTYFNEKQIHISADIVYAIEKYMDISGDYSLLDEGALELINQVSIFFMSYAKMKNGKYHLLDVIGPDEYHERVHDNAFTSYMAKYCFKVNYKYSKDEAFKEKLKEYIDKLYIPPVNKDLLIEQFAGYFKREDVLVDEVRTRIRNPKEYWGGKKGVATPTRVIKQADVITLLVLLKEEFSLDVLKKNFDFYYPYTEHGSSLSSSMYSIVASRIGETEKAYEMFLKSAEIDLGTNQKQFMGGIYIGGTHPASNGGSYLSIVYGMAGLEFNNEGFTLNPNLPKEIKGLEFNIIYRNKSYNIKIDGKKYKVKESSL